MSGMDRRRFLGCVSAALGAMQAPGVFARDRAMRIAYFNDYSPFSWGNDQQEMQGIFLDILNEALYGRMGIPVLHFGLPWKRAQAQVRYGQADAFCAVPSVDRKGYTRISQEPVIVSRFKIYTRRDHPALDQLRAVRAIQGLRGFSVGQFIGGGWANDNQQTLNIRWAPTLENTLSMLAHGRVDVHIGSEQVTRYSLSRFGMEDRIVELPFSITRHNFHLCVGRHSSFVTMLGRFDEVIRQMRQQGIIRAIQERYAADWSEREARIIMDSLPEK